MIPVVQTKVETGDPYTVPVGGVTHVVPGKSSVFLVGWLFNNTSVAGILPVFLIHLQTPVGEEEVDRVDNTDGSLRETVTVVSPVQSKF